jgi:hypothetical protein
MGEGQQETKPEQKPFRKYNEMFSFNQQYELKQTAPSANMMGMGSRCRDPKKGMASTRTKEPDKRIGPHKKEDRIDEDVCFGCGQKGHKKRDPKCPKNILTNKAAAQLYAAREIIEEEEPNDDQNDRVENHPVKDKGDSDSEDEEPYYGSQYTSEGEEVEIDDLKCQEWSEQEQLVEQMHLIRVQEIQEEKSNDDNTSTELNKEEETLENEAEFPLLVKVDNEEMEEETEEVVLKKVFRAINAGQGTDQKGSSVRNDEYMPLKLRKSSQILERPIHSKRETQTFIIVVKVNGQKAIALLDLGCTIDTVMPELTRIIGLKINELKEQVPLQLGTRGSQSKINYGMKACIRYGPVEASQYFDIVNIDRYNVTSGTIFMRKHGIVLNFKRNQVRIGDKELPTLHEDADKYLQIYRQAMHNRQDAPKDKKAPEEIESSYGGESDQ